MPRVVLLTSGGRPGPTDLACQPNVKHSQLAYRLANLIEQLGESEGDDPYCVTIRNHAEAGAGAEAGAEGAESSEPGDADLAKRVGELEASAKALQIKSNERDASDEECARDRADLHRRVTDLKTLVAWQMDRATNHMKRQHFPTTRYENLPLWKGKTKSHFDYSTTPPSNGRGWVSERARP